MESFDKEYYIQKKKIKSEKRCYTCGKLGHTKYSCKLRGTTCVLCLKDGHIEQMRNDPDGRAKCITRGYRVLI